MDNSQIIEAVMVKRAQAPWRMAKNLPKVLEALESRGFARAPFMKYLGSARREAASGLRGVPGRSLAADSARKFMGRVEASPFKITPPDPATVLHRGISLDPYSAQVVTPSAEAIPWGGGYFGGAVHHATPFQDIAESYGAGGRYVSSPLTVVNNYAKSPANLYAKDFTLEKLMQDPRSRLRALMESEPAKPGIMNLYETAVNSQHNPFVGTALAHGNANTYIPAADTRNLKALSHYTVNNAMPLNPEQAQVIPGFRQTGQGGLAPRLEQLKSNNLPAFDALMDRRANKLLFNPNPGQAFKAPEYLGRHTGLEEKVFDPFGGLSKEEVVHHATPFSAAQTTPFSAAQTTPLKPSLLDKLKGLFTKPKPSVPALPQGPLPAVVDYAHSIPAPAKSPPTIPWTPPEVDNEYW